MLTTQRLAPVPSGERINSIDVLRGVALCGILLMNIAGFGLIFQAYSDPTVMGGAEGANLWAWIVNNMFFEGTMRAMFSILFGAGMLLMTTRMEEKGGGIEVADIYYRRTIWLLIFGIIHAYLILWAGEVLFAYGLFGLFLFPFRKTAPRKLIIAAGILILCGFALSLYKYSQHITNYEKSILAENYTGQKAIPEDIIKGKEAWTRTVSDLKPDDKTKAEMVEGMHKNYPGVVLHLAGINRMVQTSFNYDYNPWDVLPMMLLGIAFFRLKIITAGLKKRAYLFMILFGYGVGIPVNYFEITTIMNDNFSVISQLKSNLTYPFGRLGMALGHIGLVMIFCKLNILAFLKTALAAVGKMALTNYIMQSVICAIIFTGVGFSLFGKLQRYELYYVVFSIWTLQLIISPMWLRYFNFGPLEWVWRSLTYQKKQPFRKSIDTNAHYPALESV